MHFSASLPPPPPPSPPPPPVLTNGGILHYGSNEADQHHGKRQNDAAHCRAEGLRGRTRRQREIEDGSDSHPRARDRQPREVGPSDL